jgi:1-acyl-sn-glycerol-3-phosphate acyltransferase
MILKILSYPRALIMATLYPFFLGAISAFCVLVNVIFNRREYDDYVVASWGRISLWMFGVKVKMEGLENIPRGGGVFLFNHSSIFDIFALAGYIPSLRFGAKVELFKIPFFGWAMRRIGILPIARQNKEEVFRVYKATEDRLRAGERIALAPEGTRQPTEEKLGRFKAGPFVFAINAQVPVIPVVIKNASYILNKGAFLPNLGTWEKDITVRILPAIETKNLKVDDRPTLQNKVMECMSPYFTTLQEEFGI